MEPLPLLTRMEQLPMTPQPMLVGVVQVPHQILLLNPDNGDFLTMEKIYWHLFIINLFLNGSLLYLI